MPKQYRLIVLYIFPFLLASYFLWSSERAKSQLRVHEQRLNNIQYITHSSRVLAQHQSHHFRDRIMETTNIATTPSSIPPSQFPSTLPFPLPDFPDHYATMKLDTWCTSEEIKTAYRQLRGEYFAPATMDKYRALQNAYVVLTNRETRWAYDVKWRAARGLPAPTPVRVPSGIKGNRNGSYVGVKDRVGELEKRDSKEFLKAPSATKCVASDSPAIEIGERVGVARIPLVSTRPYNSWIPILALYNGKDIHPRLKCRRPRYVLHDAYNSTP